MSLRKWLVTAGLAAAASVAAPANASADWIVTPFVGWNFKGAADVNDNGVSFENKFEQKLDYGVSLAAMGAGAIGFEVDFGYSPNFFESSPDSTNGFDFADDSNVTTLTANAIVGIPIGGQHGAGIRPYVVGGLGLIRTQIDGGTIANVSSSENMFGWDAGGGVMGYFTDHVGLRGDLRYLRATSDLKTGVTNLPNLDGNALHFWRATIGVVFR